MPQTLRVMAYNILYGGITGGNGGAPGGRDRTALLTAQVNAVRPDALALCECWGFLDDGAARMNAFCEAVGMRGALVEAATGNHVALLYREPWSPASTATVAAPMHHGLVRMELTNGDSTVQVIATHLNPFSSLMRLQEAQVVVSRTRPGEHTLVMGDFNTLPLDYDAPLPSRRLLDEELRPDTHVCEYLAGAGFVDVLRRSSACRLPRTRRRWNASATTSPAASVSTLSWQAASWRRHARGRGWWTRLRRAWRRTTCRWWRSSRWRGNAAWPCNLGPIYLCIYIPSAGDRLRIGQGNEAKGAPFRWVRAMGAPSGDYLRR